MAIRPGELRVRRNRARVQPGAKLSVRGGPRPGAARGRDRNSDSDRQWSADRSEYRDRVAAVYRRHGSADGPGEQRSAEPTGRHRQGWRLAAVPESAPRIGLHLLRWPEQSEVLALRLESGPEYRGRRDRSVRGEPIRLQSANEHVVSGCRFLRWLLRTCPVRLAGGARRAGAERP